jgi:SpoVK/Ycf46/Vps4 family AAA+-type ATPase
MRADILRQLLQAHADGDETAFRKAALQLASLESTAGHIRVADELRSIIAKMPPAPRHEGGVVDIAQPRGELADILEAGHREERLGDIILPEDTRSQLERVLLENRSRSKLERWNVTPRRRLLFHGPPGCGKTMAAAVLAGELGVPLMTVRLDALFSRFLGATANHLRAIFAEMPRRPGVYLFDEFDAVAKTRGDAHDVGEMRRVVTAFLQLADSDRSNSILIAATNYAELLDHAVFRRFDVIIPFGLPNALQVSALIRLRLKAFDMPESLVKRLAREHKGLSFADIARACDDAIRTMALDGREEIAAADLESAFSRASSRSKIRRPSRT